MDTLTVTDRASIEAILGDERFAVVPPDPVETGGLARIRANVGRFTEGAPHARRRGYAENALAALSPGALREAARNEALAGTDPAYGVPVRVLAAALGVAATDRIADAVPVVAAGYLTGAEPSPELEAAVAELTGLLGPGDDETVAARIGLLLQTYQATGALISGALVHAADAPGIDADAAVEEAIRESPPVPALRRVTVAEAEVDGRSIPPGTPVVLDVSAHPDLVFGAGRRPCPGAAQARAIAAGAVEGAVSR